MSWAPAAPQAVCLNCEEDRQQKLQFLANRNTVVDMIVQGIFPADITVNVLQNLVSN